MASNFNKGLAESQSKAIESRGYYTNADSSLVSSATI